MTTVSASSVTHSLAVLDAIAVIAKEGAAILANGKNYVADLPLILALLPAFLKAANGLNYVLPELQHLTDADKALLWQKIQDIFSGISK